MKLKVPQLPISLNKSSLVSSLDSLGSINSTNNLLIGSNGNGDYFEAIIDDLRIYNGAISNKQVSELRGGGDPGQMQVTLEVGQGTLSLGDPVATGRNNHDR